MRPSDVADVGVENRIAATWFANGTSPARAVSLNARRLGTEGDRGQLQESDYLLTIHVDEIAAHAPTMPRVDDLWEWDNVRRQAVECWTAPPGGDPIVYKIRVSL